MSPDEFPPLVRLGTQPQRNAQPLPSQNIRTETRKERTLLSVPGLHAHSYGVRTFKRSLAPWEPFRKTLSLNTECLH